VVVVAKIFFAEAAGAAAEASGEDVAALEVRRVGEVDVGLESGHDVGHPPRLIA